MGWIMAARYAGSTPARTPISERTANAKRTVGSSRVGGPRMGCSGSRTVRATESSPAPTTIAMQPGGRSKAPLQDAVYDIRRVPPMARRSPISAVRSRTTISKMLETPRRRRAAS